MATQQKTIEILDTSNNQPVVGRSDSAPLALREINPDKQLDLYQYTFNPIRHIQHRSGLPGMLGNALCGDKGIIRVVKTVPMQTMNFHPCVCWECREIFKQEEL